jgi:hypothetical protein
MKGSKMIKTKLEVKNGVHNFVMYAKDMTGMESAFRFLPKLLQNRQRGTGYCLVTGDRDHEFVCRDGREAQKIIATYQAFFANRRAKLRIVDSNVDE